MKRLARVPSIVLGPDDHHRRSAAHPALHSVLSAVRRRFPDGEQLITLPDAKRLAGRHTLVVHTTAPPQDERLVSLLQLIDVVRDAGAASVTCFVPYLCYQRQDRRNRPGEPVSARLAVDALAAAGADRLLTLDAHAPIRSARIPVTDLSAAPAFAAHVRDLGLRPDMVVSPDKGGGSRAAAVAGLLGVQMTALEKKKRPDGRTWYGQLPPDLSNRRCLIVDDLCSSGSTLIPLCAALAEAGSTCTAVCVTHLLTDRAALLNQLAEGVRLLSTDSCGDPSAPIDVLPLALEAWRPLVAATPEEPTGQRKAMTPHGV
ncbi:ribose-phosphate diphosphokinase (plasmid) [Streptomyces scopuliridis]|uniref:ribose-phosphate diphosphokinase n=1 Tax=Streptomyces scopuliridis TaxID=452529 RepID=UPI002DDC179E|nr:ribose-phosphate diphosphokinase [Streptomyces scopuliridis]WSB39087.1 ribose-phosphate diphosphokinase [Streptomyces scopuliridis]